MDIIIDLSCNKEQKSLIFWIVILLPKGLVQDFQENHSPVVHDTTFCAGLFQSLYIISVPVNLILLQPFYMDY
jgi:hypothetical protein